MCQSLRFGYHEISILLASHLAALGFEPVANSPQEFDMNPARRTAEMGQGDRRGRIPKVN
jgi:hypothetical protein